MAVMGGKGLVHARVRWIFFVGEKRVNMGETQGYVCVCECVNEVLALCVFLLKREQKQSHRVPPACIVGAY